MLDGVLDQFLAEAATAVGTRKIAADFARLFKSSSALSVRRNCCIADHGAISALHEDCVSVLMLKVPRPYVLDRQRLQMARQFAFQDRFIVDGVDGLDVGPSCSSYHRLTLVPGMSVAVRSPLSSGRDRL